MFHHQKTYLFLLKVDLHCNLPHFRNVSNTSAIEKSDFTQFSFALDYVTKNGTNQWLFEHLLKQKWTIVDQYGSTFDSCDISDKSDSSGSIDSIQKQPYLQNYATGVSAIGNI